MPTLACRVCELTWVDLAGFSEHVEALTGISYSARVMPRGKPSEIICGLCQRRMRQLLFGETRVDWCVRHGYWFRDGQLEAVLNNHQFWHWPSE